MWNTLLGSLPKHYAPLVTAVEARAREGAGGGYVPPPTQSLSAEA